jgi:NitT/TauT family transport system permease protein
MSQAMPVVGSVASSRARPFGHRLWTPGFYAAATWVAVAIVNEALPDVVPWGSGGLFTILCSVAAAGFALLAVAAPHSGRFRRAVDYYGPWFIAIGVWLTLWEFSTAKMGWLPKPFFSAPTGVLHVYVTDWQRLLISIGYSFRLWGLGFGLGAALGYVAGVALGWSKPFAYWGMPILRLVGPVPVTAWIPVVFYLFPTMFHASVFIVALATAIPVTILTSSGVASVERAYYDVARNLGAKSWYLISRVAIPSALPHTFVGLFMGLYYSFAVLVVAEILGAKYGLGWYIQFQTNYSAYANVYATLIIMALICAGLVKLLFVVRGRLLGWQEGFIR